MHAADAVLMRGGTSKGLYFDARSLPVEVAERDRFLIAAMGSPNERQIDGMGGGHPLTSKVAVVSASSDDDIDVDYLFLQVVVGEARVSDQQNCGNILAGVAPYALEKGLVRASGSETVVRVRMLNTNAVAAVTVCTPGGQVTYEGNARIDGVDGTAAPVLIDFADAAGSSCGALLPTRNAVDVVEGVPVTCIDNGMPVVVLSAADVGRTGQESPAELEADNDVKSRIESIRRRSGALMNLGDVAEKTVPKVTLVSPPTAGGAIATRTFIPHRVHQAIGALGAASVAAACCIPGSAASVVADTVRGGPLDIEHPSGRFTVDIEIAESAGEYQVKRSVLLRTARKLMDGTVYLPESDSAC